MSTTSPISDSASGVLRASDIGKEISYWLWFSVLLSLAQLWLVPLLYYLVKKPWTVVGLLGNGSLIFFATTITSKTGGDYFKKVKGHHAWATFGCIAVMLLVVVVSIFVFALEAAIHAGLMAADALSPERVTGLSIVLAVSGLLFSLGYTIFIRRFGERP